MIVPDTSLLLHAVFSSSPLHDVARSYLEEVLSGDEDVGFGAAAVFPFLRLSTDTRVFRPALSPAEAVEVVEAWLSSPNARFVVPGPRHMELALRLIRQVGTSGGDTNDVQLAALALENQAVVATTDAGFARFAGLRWIDPAAAE